MPPIERIEQPEHVNAYHRQRYELAVSFAPGKRVLDIACGIGYGSRILKDNGAVSVLGVDVSPEAIGSAQTHFSTLDLDFHIADCLEVDGTWDVVVSLETIEHLVNGSEWPGRIAWLMESDGVAIISTPVRPRGLCLETPPRNPYHVREGSPEEFRSLLSASFRDVHLCFQGFSPPSVSGPAVVRAVRRLWTGCHLWRQAVASDLPVVTLDQWFDRYCCVPVYMVAVCRRPESLAPYEPV